MKSLLVGIAALVLMLSACAHEEAPLETTEQPIIGGERETGHPAVGSLTGLAANGNYSGPFCTAVLIDQEWLLTAAHCLYYDGGPSDPALMEFFNGEDCEYQGPEKPPGLFYEIDAVYMHPNFNSEKVMFDVGLAHLATPITDVEPYPLERTPLDQLNLEGTELLYVGYGTDDDKERTGWGIKRSAMIGFLEYDEYFYYNSFEGAAICFGDSGGPGLYEEDGALSIVGINTFGWGTNSKPCHGISGQGRVDIHLPWIDAVMNGQETGCGDVEGLCRCSEACLEDGACDDALCPGSGCPELFDCYIECEERICAFHCDMDATTYAQTAFREVVECSYDHCEGEVGFKTCMARNCYDEMSSCWGYSPTLSCQEAFECFNQCSDESCEDDCLYSVYEGRFDMLDDLVDCQRDHCEEPESEQERYRCLYAACAKEIDLCIPPEDCDLLGGSCDQGESCSIAMSETPQCLETSGLAPGDACDPEASFPLDCSDGSSCFASGEGAWCREHCGPSQDCPDDHICQASSLTPDVGHCIPCVDEDNDKVCADEDCDDSDPDQGLSCDQCVDADDDGACADVDCDDSDNARTPAALEVCGDGVDNNCNGSIDENCEDSREEGDAGGCSIQRSSQGKHAPLAFTLFGLFLLLMKRRS